MIIWFGPDEACVLSLFNSDRRLLRIIAKETPCYGATANIKMVDIRTGMVTELFLLNTDGSFVPNPDAFEESVVYKLKEV